MSAVSCPTHPHALSTKTTTEFAAREVRHTRLTNSVSEVKHQKRVISNKHSNMYLLFHVLGDLGYVLIQQI